MELLKTGASKLGVTLSEHQLDQFETYFHELEDWNKRANLTAIIEYEAVQVKHFVDSLTVCLTAGEVLTASDQVPTRIMDVGAGAGLPGLALKIAFPEIELALVESVKLGGTFQILTMAVASWRLVPRRVVSRCLAASQPISQAIPMVLLIRITT